MNSGSVESAARWCGWGQKAMQPSSCCRACLLMVPHKQPRSRVCVKRMQTEARSLLCCTQLQKQFQGLAEAADAAEKSSEHSPTAEQPDKAHAASEDAAQAAAAVDVHGEASHASHQDSESVKAAEQAMQPVAMPAEPEPAAAVAVKEPSATAASAVTEPAATAASAVTEPAATAAGAVTEPAATTAGAVTEPAAEDVHEVTEATVEGAAAPAEHKHQHQLHAQQQHVHAAVHVQTQQSVAGHATVTTASGRLAKALTFSGPPYVPKAKPYHRVDFSHSAVDLLKIAHDNQLLVQHLTCISSPVPKSKNPDYTAPCNVASSAVNRRKQAAVIAQENHALYQRLVGIKPSKDISRDTLEAEHRQNEAYRLNCAQYKVPVATMRKADVETAGLVRE